MNKGQRQAASWNDAHKIGCVVEVTLDNGATIRSKTRSDAWTLADGTAVVKVEGITGGYMLSRVRPVFSYYITFPNKYRHELHPHGAHPDGWYRVLAKTYPEACDKAQEKFGPLWAQAYHEEGFDKRLFPKGEIGVIE